MEAGRAVSNVDSYTPKLGMYIPRGESKNQRRRNSQSVQ